MITSTPRAKQLPPLPPVPPVTLPSDLAAVIDYLSAHHGLNRGVVTTTLLTVLGTVAGGYNTINWRGAQLPLNLHLLLHPSVVAETDGWLQFLAAPMEEEVARLKGQARNRNDSVQSLETYQRRIEELPPGPERTEVRQNYRQLAEQVYPHFFGRKLGEIEEADAYNSTLLLDPTGIEFHVLVNQAGVRHLSRLIRGSQIKGADRDYGLVLVAPLDTIERLKRRGVVENWCPIILPQGSAPFSRPAETPDEARNKWQAVVTGALAIRRGPPIQLAVSEQGDAALNRVKNAAEAAAAASHRPEWYRWAVSACLKVAGILHLLAGGKGEIQPAVWHEAESLTTWLIAVQTHSVGTLRASVAGPKKCYPTKPDDIERMKRLMRKRPGATLRSLVRSLTKRPPGHWRFIYNCIMNFDPEYAVVPDLPTQEQASALAAKWREAGMPSPPDDEDPLWLVRGIIESNQRQ